MIFYPFVEPLYCEKIEKISENNLINRIEQLKNLIGNDINLDWNCDTYNSLNSNYNILDDLTFKPLIEFVTEKVWLFSEKFGIDKNEKRNLICSDAWFNISKPENYQEYHVHVRSHFSAVFYLKMPKNSGNIVFRRPGSFGDMFTLDTEVFPPESCQTYIITPEVNQLLIFRSNLFHMVTKNKSNDERISIAMNFYFE